MQANTLTAVLGGANIGLYALVYTPLKAVRCTDCTPPILRTACALPQLDFLNPAFISDPAYEQPAD